MRALSYILLILTAIFIASGCGSSSDGNSKDQGKRTGTGENTGERMPVSSKPEGEERGGFNGGPAAYLASPDESKYMRNGSSCWKNGCADSAGHSCLSSDFVYDPEFVMTVQNGDPLDLHLIGVDDLKEFNIQYIPNDIALKAADAKFTKSDDDTWRLTAPHMDSRIEVSLRAPEGDAHFSMCLTVEDAEPAEVGDENIIKAQAEAELRFGMDADGGDGRGWLPGSLRCDKKTRQDVSAQPVWRCEALIAGIDKYHANRSVATMAQYGLPLSERNQQPVLIMDANEARVLKRQDGRENITLPKDGLVAVKGYLIGGGSDYQLCTAGWISNPPDCNKGGISVKDLNADAYQFDTAGGVDFTRAPVYVVGKLKGRTLTAQQP